MVDHNDMVMDNRDQFSIQAIPGRARVTVSAKDHLLLSVHSNGIGAVVRNANAISPIIG